MNTNIGITDLSDAEAPDVSAVRFPSMDEMNVGAQSRDSQPGATAGSENCTENANGVCLVNFEDEDNKPSTPAVPAAAAETERKKGKDEHGFLRENFAHASAPSPGGTDWGSMINWLSNALRTVAAYFNQAFGVMNSATGRPWDYEEYKVIADTFKASNGLTEEDSASTSADADPDLGREITDDPHPVMPGTAPVSPFPTPALRFGGR